MASKKSFTVTQPTMLIWLALILMGVFVAVTVIDMLASGVSIAKLILVTVVIFIPCGLIALWAWLFRIQVEGNVISVRRFFGLINYRFDVSDITVVACKTVKNQIGQNQKITLYTSTGKKVPIETLMINSEKMIKFIEENVEEEKFRRSFKTLS